jgi:hypothetical protein
VSQLNLILSSKILGINGKLPQAAPNRVKVIKIAVKYFFSRRKADDQYANVGRMRGMNCSSQSARPGSGIWRDVGHLGN